jgi:hypothetical protein
MRGKIQRGSKSLARSKNPGFYYNSCGTMASMAHKRSDISPEARGAQGRFDWNLGYLTYQIPVRDF